MTANAFPSTPTNSTTPPPAPVGTAAEAEKLATHLGQVMDALVDIVQQETELVRAGRLAQATTLEKAKSELSRLYIADSLRMRASQSQLSRLMPAEKREALHRRHDAFRALLQVNLTVLATAHAVSEGIIRGLSQELARSAAPRTYGASGRTTAPPRPAVPLAVSRSL